jgi:hypothetical protein
MTCVLSGRAHLSVDGKGEVSCTTAVHRHVGLFHSSALQADLKQGSSTIGISSSPGRALPTVLRLLRKGTSVEPRASLASLCTHVRSQG